MSAEEGSQAAGGLENTSGEERLRELGWFSLEKKGSSGQSLSLCTTAWNELPEGWVNLFCHISEKERKWMIFSFFPRCSTFNYAF